MRYIVGCLVLSVFLSAGFAACKSPVGPQGEQGPQGERGLDGDQGPAGFFKLYDNNDHLIGYVLGATVVNDVHGLYIMASHQNKLYHLLLSWDGNILNDDSRGANLYYAADNGQGTPYGIDTGIPYRVFGHSWNGGSYDPNNPSMYTFTTYSASGMGGGTSIDNPQSHRISDSDSLYTNGDYSGTFYELIKINWTDIGLTEKPVAPLILKPSP
ncbi:MAG: collagen-like protein [Spirochaetaceae bacterium]|jgi:hypothetical protein|nr:collagen-like protein [Spirochaetaceae bacterium]